MLWNRVCSTFVSKAQQFLLFLSGFWAIFFSVLLKWHCTVQYCAQSVVWALNQFQWKTKNCPLLNFISNLVKWNHTIFLGWLVYIKASSQMLHPQIFIVPSISNFAYEVQFGRMFIWCKRNSFKTRRLSEDSGYLVPSSFTGCFIQCVEITLLDQRRIKKYQLQVVNFEELMVVEVMNFCSALWCFADVFVLSVVLYYTVTPQ